MGTIDYLRERGYHPVADCPRCGQHRLYGGEDRAFNALSRTDNTTYICPPCGQGEALADFCRGRFGPEPQSAWPLPRASRFEELT